ncbi:MAG: hypothetical protein J6R52_03840 [Alphaproteobacteria bacterium]|nr:hypothetical protein [Alphaproteobacteria bacterium]
MKHIVLSFLALMPFVTCPAWSAGKYLEGYGEVERCFQYPDETIPTCDGSDYINMKYDPKSYCYIPSRNCNILVEVEAAFSYSPSKFASLYKEISVASPSEDTVYLYCRMVKPYVAHWVGVYDNPSDRTTTQACANLYAEEDSYACYQDRADADDFCWDDFSYTAYYSKDQEESFLTALFATEIPTEYKKCELGISNFKTSTGLSFALYAEKYTEPSLVVGYNDGKCYGKLETGKATGTINFNYNGMVYHLVD